MTRISKLKTYDADPKVTTLARFIHATMDSSNKYAKQVQEYRQKLQSLIDSGLSIDDAKDKTKWMKKSLPLAIIGAICEGGHAMEHVVKKTGWTALDIDHGDNQHLENSKSVRDAVGRLPFVAFSGLSVSGMGVWALVKIEDPEKQPRYFEQLQKDFEYYGIVLDSTKGKNANDKRYYSFDPDAVINKDFQIYDRLPKKQPTPTRKPAHSFSNRYSLDDTRSKVESLISKIQSQRIDITEGYQEWRDLGFSMEDEFGEHGREYFHAISEFYPGYDKRECDRQYSHCLKHRGSGISIGTFFHRCREYGITLLHEAGKDNGSQSKYEAEDSAPYGYNPYTGEIFDERGYPSDWDDISLNKDSSEVVTDLLYNKPKEVENNHVGV